VDRREALARLVHAGSNGVVPRGVAIAAERILAREDAARGMLTPAQLAHLRAERVHLPHIVACDIELAAAITRAERGEVAAHADVERLDPIGVAAARAAHPVTEGAPHAR
jgi:hypothetical protein